MDATALRPVPLFQGLSAAQLGKIAALAREETRAAGDILCCEGDPGEVLFVVLRGEVHVTTRMGTAGDHLIAVLGPGGHFGEMALIDQFPRSASVNAATDCLLAVLHKQHLEELLFADRDLAYDLLWRFVRTLSHRLRDANDKIRSALAVTTGS